MASRFEQWTLDVQDVPRQAAFWSAALGYRIEPDERGDGVHLRPPDGRGLSVWLQPTGAEGFTVLTDPEGNEFCLLHRR